MKKEISWCVYIHTNKINNKKYIGQTCQNIKARWKNGSNYRSSTYFYSAIKKYGWDNFEHKVVAKNLTKKKADIIEKTLIKCFNTTDACFGYNLCSGGSRGVQNEITRKKISIANKGKKPYFTKEWKKKISEAQKIRLSDPTKNSMYGKKRPDTIEFNKKTKTGIKQKEEHIRKRVEKNKGQHRSEEVRQKMSNAAKKRWEKQKKERLK